MIASFSLKNYRSFREEQILELRTGSGKELPQNIAYSDSGKTFGVARTAAVYGANASGKSNFVQAMLTLVSLVNSSAKFNRDEKLAAYSPFLLDPDTAKQPTELSVEFFAFGVHYRYSIAFTGDEFTFEELSFFPSSKEAVLFRRRQGEDASSAYYGNLLKGKNRKIAFLPNQLYLSVAALTDGAPEVLVTVHRAITQYANINISGIHPWRANVFLENEAGRKKLLTLLKAIGTGIEDLQVEKNDETLLGSLYADRNLYSRFIAIEALKFKIRCGHRNSKGELVYFDINEESAGSYKFMLLIGHVLFALQRGEVLVIDELDSSLHPVLAEFVVELFNSPDTNPNNAQMVFTTHDITLMNPETMRRDQLYFTHKSQDGASELYSLDEFSEVRYNTPFAKWYLQDRFKATPHIDYAAVKKLIAAEVKQ